MKPIIKLSLLCGIMFIAISIHTHGLENALGGALSWLASTEKDAAGADSTEVDDATAVLNKSHFYGTVERKDGRRKRVPITKAVRARVNDHIAEGTQRNSRALRSSGL